MPSGRDQAEQKKIEQERKKRSEKVLSQKQLQDKRQQNHEKTMEAGTDLIQNPPPSVNQPTTSETIDDL